MIQALLRPINIGDMALFQDVDGRWIYGIVDELIDQTGGIIRFDDFERIFADWTPGSALQVIFISVQWFRPEAGILVGRSFQSREQALKEIYRYAKGT